MKNRKTHFMATMVVFVALVFSLVVSVTALTAAGALEGGFYDKVNLFGTVTGIGYEQADGEIEVEAIVDGENLIMQVSFTETNNVPYSESEMLRIDEYQIVDNEENVVKAGGNTEAVEIVDGQAEFTINMDGVEDGDYKLMVSGFIAEKKADQPLLITGEWEHNFTK